jgi:GT2 family glycosyltransferase
LIIRSKPLQGPKNSVTPFPEDVTALIGNVGGLENLHPCLESIFDNAGGDTSLRVLVGFNFEGESDSPQVVARDFPEVEQLRAPVRLGYCRTYNQMMGFSRGRYVLLLDDDTVIRPGTIDGMVRFMDAHPEVGIASCRTVNADGSYQKTTALMYSLRTEIVNLYRPAAFWRDGVDEAVTDWRSVGWLNGHFLMARACAIEKVGPLDEYLYKFQHEADWCLRMHRAGWVVAYVPDFEVMHIGGELSIVSPVKSYGNLMRSHINRYYFINKHYGNRAGHMFRLTMSVGAVLRLLNYLAVWLVNPGRRPEAGPKIRAFAKIALLGVATRPDALPPWLRAENEIASSGALRGEATSGPGLPAAASE